MYFYKDSEGLFHINGDILPQGNYILRVYNFETVVSVESADTHELTMDPTEVLSLQKENDDYYISLAELLFLNADFFRIAIESASAEAHILDGTIHVTPNQRAALDANLTNPPSATNAIATLLDIMASGGGDMLRSMYDSDLSGVVDDAELVNGLTVGTAVPAGALFTDTIYTHPTGAGNYHLPSGGSVGQVIKNTGSGIGTWQDEAAGGSGDMLKSVYDIGDNGVVDNAALVNGFSVQTAVPPSALFTDTIYDDTAILAAVALNTAKVSNIAHPLVEAAVPVGALFTDTIYNDTSIWAAVDANTAKETNATHTGEVTGDAALTIAAGAVDNNNLESTLAARITANDGKTSYTDASAVSANTSARHTHSNSDALDNITESGDGTDFLANDGSYKALPYDIPLAVSDLDTDLTVGTTKASFYAPRDFTLSEVIAGLDTVATGSTFIVDVNVNGTSVFSTNVSIDAGENTSITAATAAVITTTSISKGDKITIDIDQIGSTIAGKGLTVYLIGSL